MSYTFVLLLSVLPYVLLLCDTTLQLYLSYAPEGYDFGEPVLLSEGFARNAAGVSGELRGLPPAAGWSRHHVLCRCTNWHTGTS